MPGFPVLHHLLQFAQDHVHYVGDAIQPSHPLSPSPLSSFNLSQHQGLSQWVSSLHQVTKSTGASVSALVLPVSIQGWFLLRLAGLISLLLKGLSGVFSNTIDQRHQFFGAWPSLRVQLSQLYMTTGKSIAVTIQTFVGRVMSLLFNTFRSPQSIG